jgi:hypothetical protein
MVCNDLGLCKYKEPHIKINPMDGLLTQKLHALFMLNKLTDSVLCIIQELISVLRK